MNIAKPDAVAITNIGHAHVGRFGSQAIIAKTKAEIYSSLKIGAKAVVNIDEPYSAEWLELLSEHSCLTFSLNQQTADIYAKNIQQGSGGSTCDVVILGNSYQLTLNVPGVHNIMNALCAAALAKAVNAPDENIVAALAEFQPVSGRFVSQKASWGGVLIDDSYNANPASVKAAIDVLVQYAGDTVLVLGDLAELGEYSVAMHRELGEYAAEKGVKQLLTVGVDSRFAAEVFAGSKHFKDKASLQDFIKDAMQENHVVLFKGSRSSAMESLVEYFTVEGAC
jgi:UDP-N-acetylmuramoyl-tripeptide--D-alanyl-D-alanine ligase